MVKGTSGEQLASRERGEAGTGDCCSLQVKGRTEQSLEVNDGARVEVTR